MMPAARHPLSRSHPDRRGVALTAALVAVISIAAIGAYLMQTQATMAKRQSLSIDTRTALYTAEAGLAEAAFQVSQGRTGAIGAPDRPAGFNGNKYWVESERMPTGEVVLTSTGLAGRSRFRVNLTIQPNRNPVSALGFFGDEGVVVGDRVVIDGYDAEIGRYNAQRDGSFPYETTGRGARLGSNGDVTVDDGVLATDPFVDLSHQLVALDPDVPDVSRLYADRATGLYRRFRAGQLGVWPSETRIFGSIQTGVDGVVMSNGGLPGAVGRTREERAVLPSIILPTGLDEETDLIVGPGQEIEVGQRSVKMGEIRVQNNGALLLRGPLVFELERLIVEPGGYVRLYDTDGPITFYCTERIEMPFGSEISTYDEDKRAHGASIFLVPAADETDDERVVFDCHGDFRGIVYAPSDRLRLPTNLRFWGSAVAKHLTIADGAWLSFDAALACGGVGFPSLPKRLEWSALTLSDTTAAQQVALAEDAISAEAADLLPEDLMQVVYMDQNGDRAYYGGATNGFDPALAQRIVAVRWRHPMTGYGRWVAPAGASPDDIIARWRRQLRQVREQESQDGADPEAPGDDDDDDDDD